ncbi:chitobiase/beta-hexosaminidase C-terminal domain-containing protein [Halobacteriovorax sp. DPLXC-1]|uniref:chitobiase/beta-hexosaminidase C-terminal domain-containing protein n=1 Tax=Halobacteriovorax sp. DPLXC-1 TaxID=3110771 RepID=UPI002FF12E50
MTNEFKSLLRNVVGGVTLASLFSYLTFIAPSSDENKDNISQIEEQQVKNLEDQNNENDMSNSSGRGNRGLANFSDEIQTKRDNRKDRSRTSVGANTSRPAREVSREARDPAYNAREIEGSSNYRPSNSSGSFSLGPANSLTGNSAPSPTTTSDSSGSSSGGSGSGSGVFKESGGNECSFCVTSKPSNSADEETNDNGGTFTNSGSGSSNDTAVTEVTCSHDMAEGSYATPISVTISCSESATIWYCLDTGGSSCTPSIQYTAPINLPTDGDYGISYYAQASASTTDVDDLLYRIDTTSPDLSVSHDVIYAQTTQVPLQNTTASTDFGMPDYYYHQINFKSFDPLTAATPWTCNEVLNDYATATPSPQVIQTNFSTSGLAVTDQIIQTVDMPNLVIGDNHIVTVLEDRVLGVVSCQVQNVVVKDFAIADFTGTGTTPVTTGVRRTLGSFVGFGHFQAVPNSATSGQLSNTQGTTSSKQGLYTLTH